MAQHKDFDQVGASNSDLPAMAHLGGLTALTTTPVVGSSPLDAAEAFVPGTEELAVDEVRVTILGSGDPFPRRAQASGSVLIEVGNEERDIFFFDIGSGSLANFSSTLLPVESTTKLFMSHLHADHMGDIAGLIGSFAKVGRTDPVEVWGGGSDDPSLGLSAFMGHMTAALAWDHASLSGYRPTSGFATVDHEIPYDRPEVIYERNGVSIRSFPVVHGLNGAVGYRLDYAGRSVVFSGDTRPCKALVEAAEGVDLLIHECFQSPVAFCAATGLDPEVMTPLLKQAHTIPDQVGQVFKLANPKMAALWHLDLGPGVDQVLNEVANHHAGATVVSQDLTVFNLTPDAVIARQADVNDSPAPVHGPSQHEPGMEAPLPEPEWFADALLDI
jgi:ribonuclease Z